MSTIDRYTSNEEYVKLINFIKEKHPGRHITIFSQGKIDEFKELQQENVSFELLGLREVHQVIYGLSKQNVGWSQKIVNKIEEILQKPEIELKEILINNNKLGLNPKLAKSFIKYKDDFKKVISNEQYHVWAIEGFGLISWKNLLQGIAEEVGVEIDIPVSVDVHRLIRYPGSLHGKTGFKVQELDLGNLEEFNPLDEAIEELDPIVFKSDKNITQKIEITEEEIPITVIKGETFGPYSKGEKIEIPHHVAVFLLCKGVARII